MKKLIALLLAFVLVFTFAACQLQGNEQEDSAAQSGTQSDASEDSDPSGESETPNEEESEQPVDSDSKTDETDETDDKSDDETDAPDIEGSGVSESEAWYYESVSESGSYTDESGNDVKFSYTYPAFSDAGAEALNGEIEAFCQPYIDELKDAADNGWSPTVLGIRYQTGSCANIRSVLVEVMMDADVNVYAVFNYNVVLGAEATGSQILEAACIDENTLVSRTLSVAAEKFIGLYGSVSDGDFYDSQLAMTLSPDAYGKHMPLFFDEAGDLWFVGRIYSLAGAAYYDYPLPVGE